MYGILPFLIVALLTITHGSLFACDPIHDKDDEPQSVLRAVSTIEERLDRMEQTLARLEARLSEERKTESDPLRGLRKFGAVIETSYRGQSPIVHIRYRGGDEGLAYAPRVAHIESIDASHSLTSDAGIADVCRVSTLLDLDLSGTEITNNGAKHLATLVGLRTLSLADTALTSNGFKYLASLSDLRVLDLSATEFSDEDCAVLARLQQLRELRLADLRERTKGDGTRRFTGQGLAQLAKLPKLETLNLMNTELDGATLVHLRSLPSLNDLRLGAQTFRDEEIEVLRHIPNLKYVEGGLTESQQRALERVRPDLVIYNP